MGCIFCDIVKGELPVSKVYENKDFLAFMDIKPINIGHVLVIPKKHAELTSEMSDKDMGKLMAIGHQINSAIRASGVRCEGVNYFLADGAQAGQEVPHVHLHLIPRFAFDGFGFTFPVGYENKPRELLDKIAGQIQRCLE